MTNVARSASAAERLAEAASHAICDRSDYTTADGDRLAAIAVPAALRELIVYLEAQNTARRNNPTPRGAHEGADIVVRNLELARVMDEIDALANSIESR